LGDSGWSKDGRGREAIGESGLAKSVGSPWTLPLSWVRDSGDGVGENRAGVVGVVVVRAALGERRALRRVRGRGEMVGFGGRRREKGLGKSVG
jgi:hypothetical protein